MSQVPEGITSALGIRGTLLLAWRPPVVGKSRENPSDLGTSLSRALSGHSREADRAASHRPEPRAVAPGDESRLSTCELTAGRPTPPSPEQGHLSPLEMEQLKGGRQLAGTKTALPGTATRCCPHPAPGPHPFPPGAGGTYPWKPAGRKRSARPATLTVLPGSHTGRKGPRAPTSTEPPPGAAAPDRSGRPLPHRALLCPKTDPGASRSLAPGPETQGPALSGPLFSC